MGTTEAHDSFLVYEHAMTDVAARTAAGAALSAGFNGLMAVGALALGVHAGMNKDYREAAGFAALMAAHVIASRRDQQREKTADQIARDYKNRIDFALPDLSAQCESSKPRFVLTPRQSLHSGSLEKDNARRGRRSYALLAADFAAASACTLSSGGTVIPALLATFSLLALAKAAQRHLTASSSPYALADVQMEKMATSWGKHLVARQPYDEQLLRARKLIS